MKLDDSMNRSGAEREPGGREKAVTKQPLQSSHFSAVWPGVIFPRLSDSPPPDRGGATAPQNDGSLSPQGRALPDMGGGNSASQVRDLNSYAKRCCLFFSNIVHQIYGYRISSALCGYLCMDHGKGYRTYTSMVTLFLSALITPHCKVL